MAREKFQNIHLDRKVLKWMLHNTIFIKSMPLLPGPQAINNLELQEFFNTAL